MKQSWEEFRTALITEINDGYIHFQNHTFDNSFLEVDACDMYKKMAEDGCRAVGISFTCPYSKYGKDDVVFAFKDDEDELKWIHLTRVSWEHYVLSAFGQVDGEEILDNLQKKKIKEY